MGRTRSGLCRPVWNREPTKEAEHDHLPTDLPYVSHFDHGQWYYIDAHDQVSQRNFDLISLFLTMMAVPSALPPIAPTISVGGG